MTISDQLFNRPDIYKAAEDIVKVWANCAEIRGLKLSSSCVELGGQTWSDAVSLACVSRPISVTRFLIVTGLSKTSVDGRFRG